MSDAFIESLSNANTLLVFIILVSLICAAIGCFLTEVIFSVVDWVRDKFGRYEEDDSNEEEDE